MMIMVFPDKYSEYSASLAPPGKKAGGHESELQAGLAQRMSCLVPDSLRFNLI